MNHGDTIRINLSFANNQKLRWEDIGTNLQFPLLALFPNTSSQFSISYDSLFRFHETEGQFISGSFSGSDRTSEEGITATSLSSGFKNITNSHFEFSGITAELSNLSKDQSVPLESGLPARFERFHFSLNEGKFSIQQADVIKNVPEPGALSLVGLGLLGSIVTRRRKKLA